MPSKMAGSVAVRMMTTEALEQIQLWAVTSAVVVHNSMRGFGLSKILRHESKSLNREIYLVVLRA